MTKGDFVWVTVGRNKERAATYRAASILVEGQYFVDFEDGTIGRFPLDKIRRPGMGPKDIPDKATKHDTNKNRVDLVPVEAIESIAEAFTFGANKYSDNNWRKGFKYSRLYGALLRHLYAWYRGEQADPESGLSHLSHAGACLLMLITHEKIKLGEDDRASN